MAAKLPLFLGDNFVLLGVRALAESGLEHVVVVLVRVRKLLFVTFRG